ncbi:hypothetical protein E5Q_05912 [Mixia osmundae IAM 14324]|uniref:Uncharacterized protein n=1 Tax=Mixia osmundae (strain CBS 9802 / IAM 14324 / JCM 22182 / KY 12970) TaxID=764103 RepID=G7E9A0_MIXOS|nr:hypothetical protein E5Q_05912 [Mixia osmundae IAM 14324]
MAMAVARLIMMAHMAILSMMPEDQSDTLMPSAPMPTPTLVLSSSGGSSRLSALSIDQPTKTGAPRPRASFELDQFKRLAVDHDAWRTVGSPWSTPDDDTSSTFDDDLAVCLACETPKLDLVEAVSMPFPTMTRGVCLPSPRAVGTCTYSGEPQDPQDHPIVASPALLSAQTCASTPLAPGLCALKKGHLVELAKALPSAPALHYLQRSHRLEYRSFVLSLSAVLFFVVGIKCATRHAIDSERYDACDTVFSQDDSTSVPELVHDSADQSSSGVDTSDDEDLCSLLGDFEPIIGSELQLHLAAAARRDAEEEREIEGHYTGEIAFGPATSHMPRSMATWSLADTRSRLVQVKTDQRRSMFLRLHPSTDTDASFFAGLGALSAFVIESAVESPVATRPRPLSFMRRSSGHRNLSGEYEMTGGVEEQGSRMLLPQAEVFY